MKFVGTVILSMIIFFLILL